MLLRSPPGSFCLSALPRSLISSLGSCIVFALKIEINGVGRSEMGVWDLDMGDSLRESGSFAWFFGPRSDATEKDDLW